MKLPRIRIGRTGACILFVSVFFFIYVLQLANWQLINGSLYLQEAMSNRTDAVEISAARGEILDRDGNVLAGNHTVYEVIYNALYLDDSRRNSTILEVTDLLEERGETWRDILPIELDGEGNYRFKEDGSEEDDDVGDLKAFLNLADYATADDCMEELSSRYHYQGHSKEDTRTVVSVRYCMTRENFSIYEPFVIAAGVSPETVGVFGEYRDRWQGIETRVSVERYYPDGTLAPHVIGYTWTIDDKTYEEMEKNGRIYDSEKNVTGYKPDETVGSIGAEAAFEDDLRGSRGLQAVFTDENGDVVTTAIKEQPEQGHTVRLTLDSGMQRVTNRSLERNIKANKNSGLKGDNRAHDCRAGAAVAIELEDFGVLACSSYPSYDQNLYLDDSDYRSAALEDKDQSLFCRALQGVYAPGSVFKPMVAIAGLQEGEISDSTPLYDCDGPGTVGVFKYHDLELHCTNKHGNAGLYEAISGSCNCYFAELGLRLGIKKLDAYAKYFGLGESTGVELYEDTGNMTSPQSYQEIHSNRGDEWTDGNTAQAAIGQADNWFTTMQLAAYTATIANNGVRMQAHFLEEVTDYSRQELVRRHEPQVLFDAMLSPEALGVVRQAMIQTSLTGTARNVFSDYPVAVACKTGTAQTSGLDWDDGGTEENISFIAYAPANDPKIAVAVVLEHGRSGAYAMNVAKDMLDYYFGFYTWDKEGNKFDPDGNMVDDEGKVLKTKEELDKAKASPSPAPTDDPGEDGGGEEGESPAPTSTPAPKRGSDIPDRIFTGGSVPAGSPGAGASPGPTQGPTLDTPYYTGGAVPAPSPSPAPSPDPGGGDDDGGDGDEDDGSGDEGDGSE